MTDTITQLRELPELAAECWATWGAPNPAPRADRHVRSVPGSKPPTDLGAWDALRPDEKGYLEVIRSWARLVAEERAEQGLSAPLPASDTWAGVCGYLVSVASFWAGAAWRTEMESEIWRTYRALQEQARVPKPPRYHCEKCNGIVHEQPGGEWMRCEDCHHEQKSEATMRAELRRAKPMTAEAMEREWGESLGLRAKTISAWDARGVITPITEVLINRKWRPVYEPWDVMQAQQRHAGATDLAESG